VSSFTNFSTRTSICPSGKIQILHVPILDPIRPRREAILHHLPMLVVLESDHAIGPRKIGLAALLGRPARRLTDNARRLEAFERVLGNRADVEDAPLEREPARIRPPIESRLGSFIIK
jgi:hypothetical protein